MQRCPHDECGWRPISASAAGARDQIIDHLFEAHAQEIEESIPDGMVQVKTGENDEWRTVTIDDAKALHEALHDEQVDSD